tara:strand:+ start:606 stop:833 length:228 start_codon:yes stop_codon:yes gene_type:complete
MKEKSINLKISNISQKQFSNLVIEINLMAQAWKAYGPLIKIKTHNLDRILTWGRRKNEDKGNRRSGKTLEQNKKF